MTYMNKICVIGFLLLTVESLNVYAQSVPPRYNGELNVCGKVSASMNEGKSLESALVDFFLSFSDQTTPVYRSIQRAIVYNAIQGCHYDGADVVRAALRIDIYLPLLVLSMGEAGVNLQTLHDVLQQAGLNRPAIDEAFELAGMVGQSPSLGYAQALPPPFEVSGGGGNSGSTGGDSGLGQASPFIP